MESKKPKSVSYDAQKISHKDFVQAKANYRRELCGSRELNEVSNPLIAMRLQAINDEGQLQMETINRSEDDPVLWGEKPIGVSDSMSRQAMRIYSMAKAWGTYGCALYHDEALLKTLKYALAWFYEHWYGYHEIEGNGWRDIREFNWFDWFVFTPKYLFFSLMILEEVLTKEEIQKYTSLYGYLITFMRLEDNAAAAQSRIQVGTMYALLIEDLELMQKRAQDYDKLTAVIHSLTETGEREDFTHWSHDMAYNLQYGTAWLERISVAGILAGTALEFSTPNSRNLVDIIPYMFGTVLYHGRGMTVFNGRFWGDCEKEVCVKTLIGILHYVNTFGQEEKRMMQRIIKRNVQNDETRKMLESRLELCQIGDYQEILEDDSLNEGEESFAHAFYMGDKAVQQRNGYAFCLSMSSEKCVAFETINGCNYHGWHTSDGVLYLYTKRDSESFDKQNYADIRSVDYGLPGTTEDTQERLPLSISPDYNWYMPRDFVGCMDVDKQYIVAAMDFEAYHCEETRGRLIYDTAPEAGNCHGGACPKHSNDLTAKKAWFLLDREAVCLGAGITSTTGYAVNTYVENRRLYPEDANAGVITNLGEVQPESAMVSEEMQWAVVDGAGGYYFPRGGKICAERKKQPSPNGAKDMAKLFLTHGENPANEEYAYITVPDADATAIKDYAENCGVEILSNTKSLQAVCKAEIGFTGMIFYEPGHCCGITVDTPCIVTMQETERVLKLAVCEPTSKQKMVTVTVAAALQPENCDPEIQMHSEPERLTLTVDVSDTLGRTVYGCFSKGN